MKTVLILGAAGSVSHAVAKAFVSNGWRVLGLVRAGKEKQVPQDDRRILLAADFCQSLQVS